MFLSFFVWGDHTEYEFYGSTHAELYSASSLESEYHKFVSYKLFVLKCVYSMCVC